MTGIAAAWRGGASGIAKGVPVVRSHAGRAPTGGGDAASRAGLPHA